MCLALAELFTEATGKDLYDSEKTACLGPKVCVKVLPHSLFDRTEANYKAIKLVDCSR